MVNGVKRTVKSVGGCIASRDVDVAVFEYLGEEHSEELQTMSVSTLSSYDIVSDPKW